MPDYHRSGSPSRMRMPPDERTPHFHTHTPLPVTINVFVCELRAPESRRRSHGTRRPKSISCHVQQRMPQAPVPQCVSTHRAPRATPAIGQLSGNVPAAAACSFRPRAQAHETDGARVHAPSLSCYSCLLATRNAHSLCSLLAAIGTPRAPLVYPVSPARRFYSSTRLPAPPPDCPAT